MLSRYGTDNIIVMLLVAFILIIIAIFLGKSCWVSYILFFSGFLLALFTLWFFRDPDRTISPEAIKDKSIILSPADGKILEIVEENENVYLKTKAYRISIFLSPLNVHVNRSPVSGVVKYFKYNKGDYLVAYHPKSSPLNEQTHIGVENEYGKVFFKQIVGIVARRLVWDIKQGDTLEVGRRFGMMKFGSRMDVFLPTNSIIKAKIGDNVVAGKTLLGQLIK